MKNLPNTLDHAGGAGSGAKQAGPGKASAGMVGGFVVRVGRFAVLFHINPLNLRNKLCYEVVKDEEATKFATQQQAFDMAFEWGMKPRSFTVTPFETNTGDQPPKNT